MRMSLTGLVLQFAYRLQRHVRLGQPLARWLGLVLLVLLKLLDLLVGLATLWSLLMAVLGALGQLGLMETQVWTVLPLSLQVMLLLRPRASSGRAGKGKERIWRQWNKKDPPGRS